MVNLKRVEENLKDFEKFSATPGNGCSRLAFSKEIKDAGYKLVELMEDANLTVTKDLCGNIFGIRKGKDSSKAAMMDEKLMDMMENIAEKKNYSYYVLPSGAGHDTMIISKYHPTAMIFVPSINGRSHSPEEFTPYNYFEKAIDVLYELVISLE